MGYYEVLEKLLTDITDMDEREAFTYDGIKAALGDMCRLLRVNRVTVDYYENSKQELTGQGEQVIYFDEGDEGIEVSKKRFVTGLMNVMVCKVYQPFDADPWSEEERTRADLVHKTMLTFASRNRLRMLADKLTFFDVDGYRNTRFFVRYLNQLAQKENGFKGKVAIQYNLRHFSLINQQIGKNAGDYIMRRYTDALEKIIGQDGVVCRLGGDNFIALFRKEVFDEVLLHMNGMVFDRTTSSGEQIQVNSTAGVYAIPDDFVFNDNGDIIDRVLAARRAARSRGSDNIVYYNDEMEENRMTVRRVRGQFKKAIHNEEFRIYYQPKVDVDDSELSGAEALCRWIKEGEIIPPDSFIPVLEQGNEICTLDFYMLDHVCRDIRRWIDEGRKPVRISVNFSRKHHLDTELLERILSIVDKYEVPHEYIEIELTETTTDVEFRDLRRMVTGLQKSGIRTSVDDFGKGYSSLNLIRDIPWDVLKVDKCFLPNEDDEERDKENVMFTYVVHMAKELGLECVVEGVETTAQLKALKDNNCDTAQGFLFDKPMPVDEFEERLLHRDYSPRTVSV